MISILLVANTPSENTIKLRSAVEKGISWEKDLKIELRSKTPWETNHEDVIWCDGIIIGTTENFGYMSGALKDFFERIYYPCLELTEGKPAAVYVKGGLDGTGAKLSIEKILTGLKWKLIQPTLILRGEFKDDFMAECKKLGMTMAAGLDAGIY